MAIPKSSTTGSHGTFHPGKMSSHYIGIAFNHHNSALLTDGFLCHLNPIKYLRFLINRSFRGIQILRTFIFFAEPPRPKTHDRPRQIADGPNNSPSKTVIRTALPGRKQPGSCQFHFRKSAFTQIRQEGVPRVRGIS